MKKIAFSHLALVLAISAFADPITSDEIAPTEAVSQPAIDIQNCASEIVNTQLDGTFEPKDLVKVALAAGQMLSELPDLTLDGLRSEIVQVISAVIEEASSTFLTGFLWDPAIEAILQPIVDVLFPDLETLPNNTPLAGHPTISELSQFADQMIQNSGSQLNLFDLPGRIFEIVYQCNRYTDLTAEERTQRAKFTYDYFLVNTDTIYLPDFLADPVLEQLGDVLIDAIL